MPRLCLDRVCLEITGRAPPFSLAGLLPIGRSSPRSVLVDVCLEVADGERLLLTGPPQSGKSSLLRLLAGRLAATSGACQVSGSVAAVVDVEAGLDPQATGTDNLARLAGLRAAAAADLADLGELLDVPVSLYSPGMRRRLGLAAASAWPGDVVLVDACLADVDLAFRPRLLHHLKQLLSRSRLAVVAEPALAALCNRAAELRQGRLRRVEKPAAA